MEETIWIALKIQG